MTLRGRGWGRALPWVILCALVVVLVLLDLLPPGSLYILAVVPVAALWWRRIRDRNVRERRRREHRCLGCGYDLTGNESGRCPECGTHTEPLWLCIRRERRAEEAAADLRPTGLAGRVASAKRAVRRWLTGR